MCGRCGLRVAPVKGAVSACTEMLPGRSLPAGNYPFPLADGYDWGRLPLDRS
jgi:hypothetical protein